MKLGRVVGFVLGAVLTFAVGYAIVTRIPPLWALLNARNAGGGQ